QAEKELYGAGILDGGAAAARVYWGHVGLRLAALALVTWLIARRIRIRGGRLDATVGAWTGAMVTSIGVLPLAPLFGLASLTGPWGTVVQLAMRPLGEWDLVLAGPGLHRWWFLASAFPAVALTALGFKNRRLRPVIGGFAAGSAALLLQLAWSGDSAFVAGLGPSRIWALANALVCVWIARVGLELPPTRRAADRSNEA
ncbi:MAG TPA: hypothetical protein VGF41_08835, partial [Myxococcaceae bacterium]